ncbi:unnamed protein product, partial [Ectocarpus sp. 12 AP-2014]
MVAVKTACDVHRRSKGNIEEPREGGEGGSKGGTRTAGVQRCVLSSPRQHTRRRSKALCLVWRIFAFVAVQRWSSSRSTSSSSNGTTAVLVLGASVSVGFGGGCPSACSGHG